MRPFLVLALLAASAGARAQYQCTAPDGAVSFQQAPCPRGQKERALDVIRGGAPRPASGAASASPAASAVPAHSEAAADRRILAAYQRQGQVAALERRLQAVRAEIAGRARQRAADIAAVRAAAQRATADGQPPPADTDAALREIDAKYRAMAELDRERLDEAQRAVDRARAEPPP